MHAQIILFDGFDPLDVIAPYEVLHAGGTASGGVVSVELVSARAGLILVPAATGRAGDPGEVPDHNAGAGERQQDGPSAVCGGSLPRVPPRTTHRTARKNNTMAAEGIWDLSLSTPIRTSKAGRLPASNVAGRRRTVPAAAEH